MILGRSRMLWPCKITVGVKLGWTWVPKLDSNLEHIVLEQNCFGIQSFEVRSLTSIWVGSTRLYSGLPPNLLWCWLLYYGKLVKLVLWIQCALYLPSCIVINNLVQIMSCAQSNFRNILANTNPNILLKFLCENILLKIVGWGTGLLVW